MSDSQHTHHENCSCVYRPQLTRKGRDVVMMLGLHPSMTVAEAAARVEAIEAEVAAAMQLPETD